MGRNATCASSAATTRGYSHYLSTTYFSIILVICDLTAHQVWPAEARGLNPSPVGPVSQIQTSLWPVLPWIWMGTPQSISCCSPPSCVSTPLSVFLSLSVTWDQNRRVPPLGWPVTVWSPCHTGCWLSQWWARMGATAAAPCAGNQRHGGLVGRRVLRLCFYFHPQWVCLTLMVY